MEEEHSGDGQENQEEMGGCSKGQRIRFKFSATNVRTKPTYNRLYLVSQGIISL